MRGQPLKNREFYSQFYKEHDKAEKINVLESVQTKIENIL